MRPLSVRVKLGIANINEIVNSMPVSENPYDALLNNNSPTTKL